MPRLSTQRQMMLSARGIRNILRGRPVSVSFEVTFNCNADCEHCNWGRSLKIDEPTLPPEVWGNLLADMKPVIAQVSGGEPLLRRDIYDIISEMRRRDPLAVFVLTTNAQILNEERYDRLRACGIDEFSISLDYPDERHNEYRSLNNSFQKLSQLIPRLAARDNQDILLACVVQSQNFRDLPRIAQVARDWGVAVNFSIYTHLRTGREYLTIDPDGQLTELQDVVDRLIEMQAEGYPIATSPYSLQKIVDFYRTRSQPGCKAGHRFFIVNPWGRLAPCGIIQGDFANQRDLIENFSRENKCDMCYTSLRAGSEKTPYRMIADALLMMRVRKRSNGVQSRGRKTPVESEREAVPVESM